MTSSEALPLSPFLRFTLSAMPRRDIVAVAENCDRKRLPRIAGEECGDAAIASAMVDHPQAAMFIDREPEALGARFAIGQHDRRLHRGKERRGSHADVGEVLLPAKQVAHH